jgi:hypothetical protein
MDRETMEFFQTLFDSLKREMHQEFERVWEEFGDVKARLDRMEARQDRQGGCCKAAAGQWLA